MARKGEPPADGDGHTARLKRAAANAVSSARSVLADPANLQRLLNDERAQQLLRGDTALLRRLFTDPQAREVLLDDRNLLRRVLADPRSQELLAGDNSLIRRFFPDQRFRDAILDDSKLLRRLITDERSRALLLQDRALVSQALADPLVRDRILHDRHSLRSVLADHRLVEVSDLADRVAAVAQLRAAWQRLRRYAPTEHGDLATALRDALGRIRHPNDVKHAILDILCADDILYLSGAALRFPQRSTLWTVVQEILIAEEYFFESDETHPLILDCGTNFGMSLYYFKTLFPRAEIIGFEPEPTLLELARANVSSNGFADVEVLPYALAGAAGQAELFVPTLDSLGASLARNQPNAGGHSVSVRCVTLSDYLRQPVHFLKLDIEGAEDVVLEECSSRLPCVAHIYCEYHQGGERGGERLSKILAILESADFDVVVAKSQNQQSRSAWRPMSHVTRPYSASIWARNRRL